LVIAENGGVRLSENEGVLTVQTPLTPSHSHRDIWRIKPVIKILYGDYYRRIIDHAVSGPSIEIGGGSGNFKEYYPDILSSDIQYFPWLDAVIDAHHLPFAENKIGNILMIDTLHHIQYPKQILSEAARILRPGGRLIMIEPEVSLLSWIIYKHLHPEPLDLNVNPLIDGKLDPDRDPFESNQAIPHLLMTKYRNQMEKQIPQLKVIEYEKFCPISYLLSGGFRKWSLLPASIAPNLLAIENFIASQISSLSAFRLLAVLEKRA
jgi:SAM-dependent methyltransferase